MEKTTLLCATLLLLPVLGCSDDASPAKDAAVSRDLGQKDMAADVAAGDKGKAPDGVAAPDSQAADKGSAGPFTLTSTAFAHNAAVPAKYTCDGSDVSPALAWSGAPAGTQAFALLCDDPDAPGGTFNHWVLYDVPAGTTSLAEGFPAGATATLGKQGINGFGKAQYNGPCPPSGKVHHYNFTLHALKAQTGLAGGANKAQVVSMLATLSQGQVTLTGTYSK